MFDVNVRAELSQAVIDSMVEDGLSLRKASAAPDNRSDGSKGSCG